MKMLSLLEDLAVSAVAGYVGTKAMEPVGMKLYELESKADRDREDAARPGPPYEIAAKKIASLAGVTLEGRALDRASLTAHYGLALSWSRCTCCCAAEPACLRSPPGSRPARRCPRSPTSG